MPSRADRHRCPAPRRWIDARWPRRAARCLLASALVPAAFGAGCGAAAPQPAATVSATSPPALLEGAALHLPLDRYLLGPRESEAVARSYRILLAECMHRFGLPSPQRSGAVDGPATLNERRYGITDLEQARATGFRVSEPGPDSGADPESGPSKPGGPAGSAGPVDPRTLEVLTGTGGGTVAGQAVPDGGCSGEAQRRLTAGAPPVEDMYLAQRLAQDSYVDSGRDPRVRAALRAWSGCMHGHHFDYPTPLAAAGDPRFRSGPVSAAEITVATTDIACKRQTNLVGVWFTVESEIQRPEVAANREPLERIRRTNEIQLKVARSLGLG
ncbi:conserved hypothetical protein [Parafrankia sp. EAN1pec]|uniref:hypothetical protein n=1 Tax=Parafrankia sp. (strain EAN1pec) TaxID=298653 RepID=UPI0000540FA8|nr:conserved hypothetical protein [Frankia sp. EAN1pec]